MVGEVDNEITPFVRLMIGDQEWIAVIDTGFNGDLELPEALGSHFGGERIGESQTTLGGGTVIEEDLYRIAFQFDGEIIAAEAVFAPVDQILIGTHLLRNHRLDINFVDRTVILERVVRR
jgi:predicted aspartyl protease